MSVHIYNSLTQKKEQFVPQNPPVVKLYSCGVTVYDDCHIGHARSLYIFDVIRRYLQYRGFDVRFVRNITDIDDKIIHRANELKTDWKELVSRYIQRYYEDLEAMGIGRADIEPRATENIGQMISDIGTLIEKGFAYATPSGVYLRVRKCAGYGQLSGQSVEQMLTGVRKEADETKEDPLDFALWKTSKPAEPFWPSPWGNGRPGWHIECSVMSTKYLDTQTLDVHAGGRDLIFPHHENEIAQAQALTGKPFARYWIHHGLLTINGQKMSKSLGNFVTIKDALKTYHPDVLKIFFLQAHYSSPIDFSAEKMAEAGRAYERICILREKMRALPAKPPLVLSKPLLSEFTSHMDDDFNTPRGLSVLFDALNVCNKSLDSVDTGDGSSRYVQIFSAWQTIEEIAGVFSLTFSRGQSAGISDAQVHALVEQRAALKAQKQFKEADALRVRLEGEGIILEDSKEGTRWRRKI